jgi:poxvirus D5 protein-like
MNKYIELQAGTKVPKEKLDIFVTEIEKIMDGALLLDEDTVVLDFDNVGDVWKDVLNLYPTRCIKTTRGAHLYYKRPVNKRINNATNARTYIGLQADYKTGFNNKKSLVTVKQNGIMREVLNDTPIDNLPELPIALYPIYSKNTNMYEMDDGDGRNSEIYSHIRMLKDNKVEDTDIGKFANFINTKVFKKPLEQQELMNTIASAVNAESNNDGKPSFYTVDEKGKQKLNLTAIEMYMREKLDIREYRNILFYIKDDKRYEKDTLNGINIFREIRKTLEKENIVLNTKQDSEILHLIKTDSRIEEDKNKKYPISFRNGWCLYKDKFIKQEKIFTPFYMDVDYDPEANDKNVVDFINWFCKGDEGLITLYEEILGHILMLERFPHHIFFFVAGKGKNGKSTMLNMLNNWTDGLNSTTALDQFEKETYAYDLIGKIVNLGDDIDDTYIEKSRVIKVIAGGSKIKARALYSMPVDFKSTATLIFSCNNMPTFKDKSGGMARRVVCFPCNNNIEYGKIDLDLDDKLTTDSAKSTLLNLAIKGMKRIIANGGELTITETSKALTERYLIENDSIAMFFSETDVNKLCDDMANNTFTKLYSLYQMFCDENGYTPSGKNTLSKKLDEFGFESFTGAGNVRKIRPKKW